MYIYTSLCVGEIIIYYDSNFEAYYLLINGDLHDTAKTAESLLYSVNHHKTGSLLWDSSDETPMWVKCNSYPALWSAFGV